MPSASRTVKINASPDVVLGVITDFPAYPTFLPEMDECEVLRVERDANGEPLAFEVRFVVRVIRRLEYTLRLVRDENPAIRWSLVEGVFKVNDGSWVLEPLDGGTVTQATYSIDLGVGMFVPGNIVRSLVEKSLPDTLQRFKQEAERRTASQ